MLVGGRSTTFLGVVVGRDHTLNRNDKSEWIGRRVTLCVDVSEFPFFELSRVKTFCRYPTAVSAKSFESAVTGWFGNVKPETSMTDIKPVSWLRKNCQKCECNDANNWDGMIYYWVYPMVKFFCQKETLLFTLGLKLHLKK